MIVFVVKLKCVYLISALKISQFEISVAQKDHLQIICLVQNFISSLSRCLPLNIVWECTCFAFE